MGNRHSTVGSSLLRIFIIILYVHYSETVFIVQDLEQLPQGDQSNVKDRTVRLTSGQRAKIGLAR